MRYIASQFYRKFSVVLLYTFLYLITVVLIILGVSGLYNTVLPNENTIILSVNIYFGIFPDNSIFTNSINSIIILENIVKELTSFIWIGSVLARLLTSMKHVLSILFFLILAVGMIGTLCNLGTDFSVSKRRMLSTFPREASVSLQKWTWDDEIEAYLSDHLVGRDFLTGISAYMRLFTGTERLDEIYTTRTGQLVERPFLNNAENRASLQKNLQHLNRLAEEEGITITMLIPPSAGFAAKDTLPAYLAALYQDDQLLRLVQDYPQLNAIELTNVLCEGNGDRFYRTDNHWNADGAHAAYEQYLLSRNRVPKAAQDIVYESNSSFHGSTLSRSALWLTPWETIRYPLPDCSYSMQIEQGEPRSDLYFREALSSHDPYAIFFNGNYGTVRLQNLSETGEGVLLIVKDSFANAVVPLLLPHYKTIIMIDPRFFRGSVSELIVSEGADELLCICSLKTIVTDPTILLLK